MKKTTLAILASLTARCLFGFSYLFGKIALSITTPTILICLRFILAFFTLNLVVLFSGQKLHFKGKPVRLLLLLGLFQPVLYFVFETNGLALTPASVSGLMLALSPAMCLFMGRVFLHEHYTPFQIFCAVISVIGVAFTTSGSSGGGTVSLLGLLLLLGSTLSGSCFTILSKGISTKFTAFERTYVMFALGCVSFTVLALMETRGDVAAILAPLSVPRFWPPLLFLAVLCSTLGFILINYSLNYITAGLSALLSNFGTAISVLAGVLILHEPFSVAKAIGVVIILAAVCGVSYHRDHDVTPVEEALSGVQPDHENRE